MKKEFFKLESVQQTGAAMKRLAWNYRQDMAPYQLWSFQKVFDKIKNIPYRFDLSGIETLQRPAYTMRQSGDGGDCDCKAICLLAYCYLNEIPAKIMALARRATMDLHHVILYCKIEGNWIPVDTTYPHNSLGRLNCDYAKKIEI
jgi:hypothetical protein